MSTRPLQNDLLLRTLAGEPTARRPIWLMRQAGRYLPEYRATRARAGSFMDLCRDASLCTEVAMQPLARYDLDAAILFSDILTIPDAMGLGLQFVPGEGPKFAQPIRQPSQIDELSKPASGSLDYVNAAVRAIRQALGDRLPLIGFAGSPWTLACYMIQGQGSRDFAQAKAFLYQHPQATSQLVDLLADIIVDYLTEQLDAGADVLMLFDSWGGVLPPAWYRSHSLAPMARIVAALSPRAPVIVFSKAANQSLAAMAKIGAAGLGVDWTIDLGDARRAVGPDIALQGNLDPAMLLASPRDIAGQTKVMLDSHGPGPGLIVNLGHGLTPDVPPDHVHAFIDAVHNHD